jgi:hypothetical protein
MAVHQNSLENLKKGKATQFVAGEKQAIIARKGAVAMHEKRAEKKNLIELFEIAQQAKVPDAKVAERLRKAGLPDTFAGQMAYNVIQKAGTNPLMLQTLLKALGLLNDNPNVTVNTTPIIIGNENELQD